jgi:hydrogenase maturation protease
MSTAVLSRPTAATEEPRAPGVTLHTIPTHVEVLVCGSPDRGDDSAAIRAVALIADEVAGDVVIRTVGQLDIEDLLSVPPGAGVVIADTAVGLAPGWVVEIPLAGLGGRASGVRPRSSHALSIPDTIDLATLIRGAPLDGILVAIGGTTFGFGEPLSWPVTASLPAYVAAIVNAIERVRACVDRTELAGTRDSRIGSS